jgi:hypothetical protein
VKIRQISIFLENKSGRLAEVTKILGANGVNIRALSIADTTDFGILRLIVNDPELAHRVLREAGFAVSVTEVVAVEVADEPGGLARVLEMMQEANLNIEYLYAFVQKTPDAALVVCRVEQVDEAVAVLRQRGVRLLSEKEVYSL